MDLEILNAASKDKIILGICMGMQILFKSSEEAPSDQGLTS